MDVVVFDWRLEDTGGGVEFDDVGTLVDQRVDRNLDIGKAAQEVLAGLHPADHVALVMVVVEVMAKRGGEHAWEDCELLLVLELLDVGPNNFASINVELTHESRCHGQQRSGKHTDDAAIGLMAWFVAAIEHGEQTLQPKHWPSLRDSSIVVELEHLVLRPFHWLFGVLECCGHVDALSDMIMFCHHEFSVNRDVGHLEQEALGEFHRTTHARGESVVLDVVDKRRRTYVEPLV
jgi:hypothetical protein